MFRRQLMGGACSFVCGFGSCRQRGDQEQGLQVGRVVVQRGHRPGPTGTQHAHLLLQPRGCQVILRGLRRRYVGRAPTDQVSDGLSAHMPVIMLRALCVPAVEDCEEALKLDPNYVK